MADQYTVVENDVDDGLTEMERWGSKVFRDMEEYRRVYDAIWTEIAAKQYKKDREKIMKHKQQLQLEQIDIACDDAEGQGSIREFIDIDVNDADAFDDDVPPWLGREVSVIHFTETPNGNDDHNN